MSSLWGGRFMRVPRALRVPDYTEALGDTDFLMSPYTYLLVSPVSLINRYYWNENKNYYFCTYRETGIHGVHGDTEQ